MFIADAGQQVAIVEPDGTVLCRPKAVGAACPASSALSPLEPHP